MKTGIVFKIQKYSIHDGPGIRTAVFLKGCPLNCWWCHNPEGRRIHSDIVYHERRCLRCGRCIRACDFGALGFRDGVIVRNVKNCAAGKTSGSAMNCAVKPACVETCPAGALETIGTEMTVRQVMDEIEKDLAFYDESGGGVTFTGGEPFTQFDFLKELLVNCCEKGIHTAIETSGYTCFENIKEASLYTGLFLYDLKLMDDDKHKKYTGVSNRLVLDNLKRLAELHENIRVRIPLIPGINDDEENIGKTCSYLNTVNIRDVDILPYHNTGIYKYEQLGIEYRLPEVERPGRQALEEIAARFAGYGIRAKIGG